MSRSPTTSASSSSSPPDRSGTSCRIAIPFLSNVVSIGDVLLAAGIAWFLFSSIAHGSSDPDTGVVSLWNSRPRVLRRRGSSWASADRSCLAAAWDSACPRPQLRSWPLPRMALGTAIPTRLPTTLAERVAAHPYVRLARDARFSAFWLAGIVSLFGDRLHQIALGVMVLAITGSALQTGLVFLAATLPNLVLGPIAGTFVDRWDQRRVMIVSDLVRAGLVLLIPFVVEVNIWLVYPLVFRHHHGEPLLPPRQGRRRAAHRVAART